MKPSTRMVVLGGRKLWTPAALGSLLALWLDADDINTLVFSGSTVSEWRDKSGNARHVSQSTPINQPGYTAKGLNGKPALTFTFSGSSDPNAKFLDSNFSLSALSIAYVANLTQNTQTIYYPIGMGQGNLQGSGISNGGILFNQRSLLFDGFSGLLQTTQPVTVNQPFVTFASMSISGRLLSFNGNTPVTDGLPQMLARFRVGGGVGGSWMWHGEIGEIVLTNNILTTIDRQSLVGYLAHKRGLTANLPSDHPFKFTPPYI